MPWWSGLALVSVGAEIPDTIQSVTVLNDMLLAASFLIQEIFAVSI